MNMIMFSWGKLRNEVIFCRTRLKTYDLDLAWEKEKAGGGVSG